MSQSNIVVVSTQRNAGELARKCILSVSKQREEHVHLFIDDGSDNDTLAIIASALLESRAGRRRSGSQIEFWSHDRAEGRCALQNVWEAVNKLPADTIVCWVDGDDWLAHPDALSVIREEYELLREVWMTWGQFVHDDGTPGWASEYPAEIRMLAKYRQDIWRATHLKTFRAGLFQKIRKEDLMCLTGQMAPMTIAGHPVNSVPLHKWLEHAIDLAVMFPMLEMARYNTAFVSLPIYVYSGPTNDYYDKQGETWRQAERIRAMPRYERLVERPW